MLNNKNKPKRAIILCAGMATRLAPLSLYTHKALLPIQNLPLIEHTIQYLQSHNIKDITLILGYKAEDFFYLQNKYSKEGYHVDFRISQKWQEHNNYSSMQLVYDKFEDCLVIEGDIYIKEDFIPLLNLTQMQYLAQPILFGKEWELICDKNNRIREVKTNQTSGLGLLGISYWPKNDSLVKIKEQLELSKQNDYWDDSVFTLLSQIEVYALSINKSFAFELDSMSDVLRYKCMNEEEIACLCSENQKAIQVAKNTFEIQRDSKKQLIIFEENNISIRGLHV